MPRTKPAAAAQPRHPDAIADLIVDAILAGRIAAGQRLGEQAMADLFGVSRTLVREALGRLSARGMVEVNARRGWYVVQPSMAEAHDAFQARLAIETGLVHALPGPLSAPAVRRLKRHVAEERAAIRRGDAGERSYLLGEFHVCFAECAGNALLADILKDLTARTTLIATLYQSNHDAARSCADHAEIVAALEAGDQTTAARLVRDHILDVANHLGSRSTADDPLDSLRAALWPAPGGAAPSAPPAAPARRKLFTNLMAPAAKPRVSTRRPPKES
jgi:DNA-binding GntR family transcriptional regulator